MTCWPWGPPESSAVQANTAMVALPGPRPILIRGLPKVFTFTPKAPQRSCLIHLNLLDIDPNYPIPEYFDDFLTLAWLAFLIPDQTKEPAPTRKELEDLDEEDVMEISLAQFTPRKRKGSEMQGATGWRVSEVQQEERCKTLRFQNPSKEDLTEGEEGPGRRSAQTSPPSHDSGPSTAQAPAPYLTKEVVQGIAMGFLQIHPSDVSVAIIQNDINDN